MSAPEENSLKTLRQLLEIEQTFGVQDWPVGTVSSAGGQASNASKEARLAELETQYRHCMECPLSVTRTNVVFGSGNSSARLMFIGEAPGFDEDREGKPFVGAAGQLLTKIIQAMKLERKDVYIANILKCRPPQNRNPLPDEIETCSPILLKQIEIIEPEIICTLGKFAAQTLLKVETPISRLRGRFHDWNGIKLMPTFHPAYLLRNPDDKKLVWEDMKKIISELGLA